MKTTTTKKTNGGGGEGKQDILVREQKERGRTKSVRGRRQCEKRSVGGAERG